MRDEFPKAVTETIAKRVGLRCSNPQCRKPTGGPHTDDDKAVNVGVAGHITAASVGGPRYDAGLSLEQRRSADNCIWLCQNCGKLVDNDAERFPVRLLREWRQTAEGAAREEIESTGSNRSQYEEHRIRFYVDDWTTWWERGNLPGDFLLVISEWRRGDPRYSCTLRFRNELDWEDQLHRFRVEFRAGDRTIASDISVPIAEPLILPPRKWVSVDVDHGLRDQAIFKATHSVWLLAETIGDNAGREWPLAHLAMKGTIPSQ